MEQFSLFMTLLQCKSLPSEAALQAVEAIVRYQAFSLILPSVKSSRIPVKILQPNRFNWFYSCRYVDCREILMTL